MPQALHVYPVAVVTADHILCTGPFADQLTVQILLSELTAATPPKVGDTVTFFDDGTRVLNPS